MDRPNLSLTDGNGSHVMREIAPGIWLPVRKSPRILHEMSDRVHNAWVSLTSRRRPPFQLSIEDHLQRFEQRQAA
jgi:hypothetical protein